MRHYLIYSTSAHFALLAALLFLSGNSFSLNKPNAYYIDFIGSSRIVTMDKINTTSERAQDQKARPVKKPPEEQEDTFIPSAKSLPKPSVLNGAGKLPAGTDAPSKNRGESGGPVVADFSNFPYPWYITQVREALWTAWTTRMPSSGLLKCTIKFEILRNGSAKGAAMERSSGNRLFDSAAETSVENAGPFPPLPADYYEDRLTVHVEFKTME